MAIGHFGDESPAVGKSNFAQPKFKRKHAKKLQRYAQTGRRPALKSIKSNFVKQIRFLVDKRIVLMTAA